jgi:hypothetical protein
MHKHILPLLVVAALLGGCAKATSTNTGQASTVATDATAAVARPAVSNPLTVYPGATKNLGQSTSLHDGSKTTNVEYYDTKDDGPTVAAWYTAHLPADWERDMGAPGKKIAGVFSSPDQSQMVTITGGGNITEIMVATEVAR